MAKRKKKGSIPTFLSEGAQIEGTLIFENTIRIDGHVKGVLKSDAGTLIVGKTGVIEAEIHVDTAIIMGRIQGRVVAGQRIELFAPAEVDGDIMAPVVSMEKGVRFSGNCGIAGRDDSQPQGGAAPHKAPS